MNQQKALVAPHQRELWFVALFACIGIFGYLLRTVHGFTMVPGDLGDPRFNSVILEHFYQWMQGKSASLWSPEFFYPYPNALAFSDNHFGTAWIYAIARLTGMSREVAFDAWFCTGSLLSYFCCAYATRQLGFGWPAAAVAAFIFAYSPPVLAQEVHAQLIYRFAIPLAVLELWRILDLRRFDRLPWLATWMAVQFFCSIYLGFFLMLLAIAITATNAIIFTPSRQPWRNATPTYHKALQVGIVAVSLILSLGLALMLRKYHLVAKEYGFTHGVDEIKSMLPRMGSYFIADRSKADTWVGSWITDVPMRHEHQMFFGLVACMLALLGIVWGRRSPEWSRITIIFTVALSMLIAATLSIGGFSLYRVFIKFPGFNSIRAVTRISLVMLLPVAWLSATGMEALTARYPRMRSTILLGIAVLLAAELLSYEPMHVPITKWQERLTDLSANSNLSSDKDTPIIFALEAEQNPALRIYREIDGMMLAQDLGVPSANGYSGNLPADFGSVGFCMAAAQRIANGADFKRLPATELSSMLSRLVVVPASSDCPDFSMLKPYKGALPDSVFQNVSIAVVDQKKDGPGYVVTMDLTNQSSSYIPALSMNDEAVQFSWQFVAEGQSPNDESWNTRAPLKADVPAGGHLRQDISVQAPTSAGHYVLVFSLVQDKVGWFHHKGMKVAVSNTSIDFTGP